MADPFRLTAANVMSLPAPSDGRDRVFYRDHKLAGLALCVLASGARRWYVDKFRAGRLVRLKIDDASVLTLPQARDRAQKLLTQISDGVNVVAERRASRVRGMTLDQALEGYLADRVNLKPRTRADYRALLDRHGMDWKHRALAQIDGETLKARHRRIGENDKAGANHFVRIIRALWNWAAVGDPKTFAVNPARTISATKSWYKIERRRTRLQPHEIGPWWRALDALDDPVTRAFLKLLLLLGLRIGEAGRIALADLDLQASTIAIAGKTGKRIAYLGTHSAMLVAELPRPKTRSEPLFGSRDHRSHTVARKALRAANATARVAVTPHDLRRTNASVLEAIGAPYIVTKTLLGHALPTGDVSAGYIVPDEALLRHWQQKLEDAVMVAATASGPKVVPLKQAGKAKGSA